MDTGEMWRGVQRAADQTEIDALKAKVAALEDELNRESYKQLELTSLICEVAACAVEPDIGLSWLDVQMERDVWTKVLKVSHYPRPDPDGAM